MIYLSLGSNLKSKYGDRFKNIKKIISLLKKEKFTVLKTSSFYETPSYPIKNKPKFINIIVQVKFTYGLESLFKKISLIEKKMGRIRKKKNQSRTCDIDVVDYNGIISRTKKIFLPHPKAHKRNFVLYPLKEVFPRWVHPKNKYKINKLINNLSQKLKNEIKLVK